MVRISLSIHSIIPEHRYPILLLANTLRLFPQEDVGYVEIGKKRNQVHKKNDTKVQANSMERKNHFVRLGVYTTPSVPENHQS